MSLLYDICSAGLSIVLISNICAPKAKNDRRKDKKNTIQSPQSLKIESSDILVIDSIDTLMLYCIHLIFVFIFSLQTQRSIAAVPNTYTFTTENV